MKASLILYNGKIFTENTAMPWAEAVAIRGNKIICVGEDSQCRALSGSETEMIDLNGRVVLPGLLDGHTHPTIIAKTIWRVHMPVTYDVEVLLDFVKDYCQKHPVSECPYFFGENYFAESFGPEGPSRQLLDQYVSDRPARLQDFCDHACWYNTKALELMGLMEPGAKNPMGPMGEIEFLRDENGIPTGWAKEPGYDHEKTMFEAIGWAPPENATEEMQAPFLDYLKDRGVMALMDGYTEGEEAMKLFYDMDKAGRLDMYYEGSCILEEYEKLDETIATLRQWQEKYTTEHVGIGVVKFFMDGTNELGDSASLEPMHNDPTGQEYGRMNMTAEQMADTLVRLNEEGLDFHIHVVCDRSYRTICDAVEKARQICGDKWNIYVTTCHCELIHPDDKKRVNPLGIFIDWSCHWSGGYFGESAMQYLGEERFNTMYDFKSIIADGGCVGFSSDVFTYREADRADPYFGMQLAMTRYDYTMPMDEKKFPGGARPPASAKFTLEELLKGYTYNNAYRMRLLEKTGTIEAGKMANLVVLNKDIFKIPTDEIHTIYPDMVYFEGKKRKQIDKGPRL